MSKYEKLNQPTRGNVAGLAGDLDEVARQGALRMLREVLEAEVEEFLGRRRRVAHHFMVGFGPHLVFVGAGVE